MSAPGLVLVAVGLPLLASGIIPLLGRRPNLRESFTLLTGAVLFLVVLSLTPGVMEGGRPAISLFEIFPGLSLAFRLEPLGLLFALVASGLWFVTSVYSIGYMRGNQEKNQTRYYTCFALAIFGAMGAAMAANMLTLFIFYEVLTLSTYPLVSHHGTEKAVRGARIYLGILLATSIGMLLLATIMTWVIAGTLDFREGGILAGKADDRMVMILLILYAFGTGKAALMPFHRWLPAAMVAPTPVSALLHAVAVVKAGVFTVLKVVVYIFGIDLLHTSGASTWLMAVAGATVILASLVALTKDNLKARLAYSTISQLSYIVMGAALANAWGIIGGGMHILMHAFGKITLFFCAGAFYTAARKTEVSQLRGIGSSMPITTGAFLIGALSVIGVPPMGGAWSKWYLGLGAVEADQLIFLGVLMISSLLNIAYLMPVPVRGFFSRPPEGEGTRIKEAPPLMMIPLVFTALGCIVLFFAADQVYRLLAPLVQP